MAVPTDGVESYQVWIPELSEESILADHDQFISVAHLIAELASRGKGVAHQYGNYSIAALTGMGLTRMIHHLGWVDRGEPAKQPGVMIRSCRTYVPGVRDCLPFGQSDQLGRPLIVPDYLDRYCECGFCEGAFAAGEHPLDLLLEAHLITDRRGRQRLTPTPRAVAANSWHFLWSRHIETWAFAQAPAFEVVGRDIERAARLASSAGTIRLRILERELRTA
jgi:hypothetical protein